MKMIKSLKVILVVLVLNSLIILSLNVKADSGFDSSWDSGGSWSSSSSYDSDYRGSSITVENYPILSFMLFSLMYIFPCGFLTNKISLRNDRKKAKKIVITLFIIRSIIFLPIYLLKQNEYLWFDFIVYFIFMLCSAETKKDLRLKKEKLNYIDYKILDNTEILNQIPNLNIDNFYKETFNIYKEVQLAWMDNDIERVRSILSDEMFNTYRMQLETLRVKNQKNIMEDITLKNVYITNIIKENNKEIIDVIMNVTCKDYLIDITTKKVLRGNKDKVWNYEYKLSYMRTIVFKNTDTCPNCGAPLNYGQSVKCEHCGTIINRETDNFVLIDKKMLKQLEK